MNFREKLKATRTVTYELARGNTEPHLETERDAGIIFIGLGGTGCRTVDAIRDKYSRRYKDNGRVSFLAIDSDKACLASLCGRDTNPFGEDEVYDLFTDDVHKCAAEPAPEVLSWCTKSVPISPIAGGSACGIRQAGRFMLCATQNYSLIKKQISNIIFKHYDAGNTAIRVYLIAGLCGGTGGGIFMDMAYMINSIFQNAEPTITDSRLFGVFYLPDMYAEDWYHRGEIRDMFFKNAYASLKELNYFVSLKKTDGFGDFYSISVPGIGEVSVHGPAFKEGCIMPISRPDERMTQDEIVQNTADALLFMSTQTVGAGISFINVHAAGVLGVVDKMFGRFSCAEREKTPWLKYTAFTETGYITPSYKSLGAYQVWIHGYCAYRIIERLKRQKKDYAIASCNGAAFFEKHSRFDVKGITGALKKACFGEEKPITFDNQSFIYPRAGFAGRRNDTSEVILHLRNKVREVFVHMSPHLEKLAKDFVMNTKSILQDFLVPPRKCTMVAAGDVMRFLAEFASRIKFTLKSTAELDEIIEKSEKKLNLLGDDIDRSLFVRREEAEAFAAIGSDYANALLDRMIIEEAADMLTYGIIEMTDELRAGYEPFELLETATEDYYFEIENEFRKIDSSNLYGLTALSDENRRRLMGFIDNWADSVSLDALYWNEREMELAYGIDGDKFDFSAAATVMRLKIDRMIAPLVRRAEGLVMVAFDTAGAIKSIADIDSITDTNPLTSWQAPQSEISSRVAEFVMNEFGEGLALQPAYLQREVDFACQKLMICVPECWGVLGAAIRAAAPNADVRCCEDVREISCVKLSAPLELFRLNGIQKWALSYAKSDADCLHLDFGLSNWKLYLPEICGADAAACYGDWGIASDCTDALAQKDMALYDVIAQELDFCLSEGLIRKAVHQNEVSYTVCSICEKPQLVRTTAQRLRKVLPCGMLSDEVGAVLRIVPSVLDDCCASGELTWQPIFDNTSYLKEDEAPDKPCRYDADRIKNIHRLIRSDMRYIQLVLSAGEGQLALDELKELIGI